MNVSGFEYELIATIWNKSMQIHKLPLLKLHNIS